MSCGIQPLSLGYTFHLGYASHQVILMVGNWCPIIHRLNLKPYMSTTVKVIEAALGLSQHLVHALVFEVRFHFRSLTITKPITKEVPIHLGHRCPAIRFK